MSDPIPSLTASSGFRSAPKYSFTSAPPSREGKNNAPGPGHYGTGIDASRDKFNRSASWSMGGSGRDGGGKAPLLPGPGSYQLSHSLSTRTAVFTKEDRLRTIKKGTCPGPGQYYAPGAPGGTQISIAGKPEGGPRRHDTPGPGAYKPSFSASSGIANVPRVGFGASTRGKLVSSKTPGPGAYEDHITFKNVLKGSGGGITIKGKYPSSKAEITPGPGAAHTSFK